MDSIIQEEISGDRFLSSSITNTECDFSLKGNNGPEDELDALIDHDYDVHDDTGTTEDEKMSQQVKDDGDELLSLNQLTIGAKKSEGDVFDQGLFAQSKVEDESSNSSSLLAANNLDDVLRAASNSFLSPGNGFNNKAYTNESSGFFSSMDGGNNAPLETSLNSNQPPVSFNTTQTFSSNIVAASHVGVYSGNNNKDFLGPTHPNNGNNLPPGSSHGTVSSSTSFPPPVRTFIPPTNNNEDLIVSNLPDLYAKFWELSFKLFFNVCSPFTSCHECLTIIEDIIVLVHKWGQLRSPTLVVALDVAIQRAMYELSDKMCKPRLANEEMSASTVADRAGYRSDDGMENIEDCVSVMSHLALPLCWNVQNDFNLNFLAEGTHSLGSKMQTLNRQLQELVAWTSIIGQTKAPVTFVDGSTAGIPDFSGVVRVDSPRSQATLEMLDHTMLSLLVENGSNQSISTEFMDSIEATLLHIISRHMGTAVDIHKCGAYALGTIFSEAGPELDYVVLTPQSLQNVTAWKRIEDPPSTSRGSIMKQCERIVELDMLSDNAIKHVKACIKDFIAAIGELLSAVRSFTSNRGNFPPEFLQQNYQYLMMLNSSIEEDTEHLRVSGERFLEKFEAVKLNRMRTYPSLPVIISKIELLQDSIDKDDKEKNGFIRKTAKAIEKPIRDAGFAQVRCMTTRARFVHINFVAYDNRMRINVPCTVVLENELPLQGTLLIREYMRYDRSGKIRGFFSIIKKFVKSHKICDVSTGFLSMFAWYIMGLHVLLRFNYIPNIHQHGLSFDENPYGPEYMAFANAKINNVHIMELLDRFFRYYVEDFDTFLRVVSIQGQGEILRKADWPKNPVLWRISIEDPFAPLLKKHCYDLGSTLSRPGQLTTFKAMRRAVYGIRSIVAMGMDSTRVNMKKFFSRAELIHLARRSDYVGAAIIPPRQWTRKISIPVLLSLKNLQEPLSPDKVQAIAQLNLEDSVAMISPRDQTPRSVVGSIGAANSMFPGGSSTYPQLAIPNNQVYKPKEDMTIDSRYAGMPNSGRSQYSDYSNASQNISNQQRFGFGENQYGGNPAQPRNNYPQQQQHQANLAMYGNNRSAASVPSHYQGNSRYQANNHQADYYQNANYPPPPPENNYNSSPYQTGQSNSSSQPNFFPNSAPAPSRPGLNGFPAPNIVNGQVLNPYVPAPTENKIKKPTVPPIPLQGISSKSMMPNSSVGDGSWSQRSGWGNNEAPYSDRYNSSMTSSRSDYSSATSSFPQGYGKPKPPGMDSISPMVTGRSSDSDGMFGGNDHYGNRGQGNPQGGNYYGGQMNQAPMNNVMMGFENQTQQVQLPYDNNAGMGGGFNNRNNRSNYGNHGSNYRDYGANNNANSFGSSSNNNWEAPESSRSWNPQSVPYDFSNNKQEDFSNPHPFDQKSFNLSQGGSYFDNDDFNSGQQSKNHSSLWLGSNPNTARSAPSADFNASDEFAGNYSSRKNLSSLDNNSNNRFY